MTLTRDRVHALLLTILGSVALLFTILALLGQVARHLAPVAGIAAILLWGLRALLSRGWPWTAHATVLGVAVLILWGLDPQSLRAQSTVVTLIPAVLAALLLPARAVLPVFGGLMLGLGVRAALDAGTISAAVLGPSFSVENLIIYSLIAGGIALSSAIATHASEQAEASAAEARTALVRVERQADDLTAQVERATAAERAAEEARAGLAEQLATVEAQRQVIQELSVPILPVGPDTLVLPLVGALDSTRAQLLLERALDSVASQGARVLILDVTGVAVLDTAVARALLQVAAGARLLGAEATLVGIRPEVAQTLVGLGADLDSIKTHGTLASSLAARQGARG